MSFIERLKNTVIEVASGENHFTMERGSFDYSQSISEWVRPVLSRTETIDTGFRSFYNAEDSEFVLEVREEKGLIKAALTDRSGSGYNRFRISFPSDEDAKTTVKEGWEPHYAVIYGDCADSLEILGNMLDIEVERY